MLREYRPGSNGTGRRRGDPPALGGRRCRHDNGLRGPRTGPMGARPVPLPRRHHGDQPIAVGERHGRWDSHGVRRGRRSCRCPRSPLRERLHVHPPPAAHPARPSRREASHRPSSCGSPPASIPPSATRANGGGLVPHPSVGGRRLPVGHGDQTGADQPGTSGFQSVDVATLDDDALGRHLAELLEHYRTNTELHFWLHGHDIGPIARYLYAGQRWGIAPVDAIPALSGASPSTSAPVRQLRPHASAHRCHRRRPGIAPEEVRAVSPEVARSLDEYLAERGQRQRDQLRHRRPHPRRDAWGTGGQHPRRRRAGGDRS